MKNKVSDGKTAVITAPAAVKSGNLVIVGGLLGAAVSDIASGAKGVLDTSGGVYILTGTAALAASTVGATVYTASTNTVIDGNAITLSGGTDTIAIGQLERATDGTDLNTYIRVKTQL